MTPTTTAPAVVVPATGLQVRAVAGDHMPARLLVFLVAALVPAWALGMYSILWIVVIPPIVLSTLRSGWQRTVLPHYFGAWVVFLVCAMASFVQLEGAGQVALWGMRIGWYLGATALLVYLMNERNASVVIVGCMVGLWAITIAGGWAGILASDVTWSGAFARVLPGIVRENSYIVDLTSPAFAEVQRVGGEVLRRPSAPYAYTNNWGSTVSMLTPIALAAAVERRFRISPAIIAVLGVASVPPLLLSLNRGAWLSLGVGFGYVALHRLRSGDRRALLRIAALIGVVVVAAIATGALGRIGDQLSARTGDSDSRRTTLYRETISETIDSPILGYGSPRQSAEIDNPDAPPVGTHGQLWMVVFSHGFVAAAGYVGFFALTFAAVPASSPTTVLAKASLLIGIFQLPFYGHLPVQLFIMMSVVAFLYHEHVRDQRR